ncbi:MAG TPA: serine/threonine-protein kinase [Thermoanaerobaculia bacterium]|jgi:serine/threonine-protein kinase|nr:serine/threonine-protein kinase [Thermoanaerobaculia bacterium]
MPFCVGCSVEVPDGTTICPACGAPSASGEPTLCDIPTPALFERGSPVDRGRNRFAAGTVLASRYRIVTALGRGGMGEVYRADDLKLNQTVALKFLPSARSSDSVALARMRQEVRLARQISHPSVCRVFDLGEIEGQSFLCMEYIDGEDLASLLRRIGRLPVDKALEIALHVASGLAAIHDGGLLHRDLKPGNVMIDGRGRARITDFGLAIQADEASAGRQAGTPSYMAPEQHAGSEASPQIDLYAFGLVVYEMLAGHPTWPAEGGPERPALPASVAEGIDARIRTVLLRCLEVEPTRRPASALHVVAALTGRDPLALAAAEGLTLSPEMVAAAPRAGTLRPALAVALLAAALATLAVVIALAGKVQAFQQIPSEYPPDVLADRARSLLHGLGAGDAPRDWYAGFYLDSSYRRFLASALSDSEAQRLLASGRPPLYIFWLRTSPDLLVPANGAVTSTDPPLKTAGETYVELDLGGRLHYLKVIPASDLSAGKEVVEPNWQALLAAAGFDAAHLKAVTPLRRPPVFADRLAAWEGRYPGIPALPIRLDAAALQGKPVWLDITGPWNRDPAPGPGHEGSGAQWLAASDLALQVTALLTGLLLARRSLRLGRGDLRGAFRLATFAFSVIFMGWLISNKYTLTTLYSSLSEALASSLQAGVFFWMFYLAFEPSVRRLWPKRIVAWNRLLAGKLRDPLVGRDVLIGSLVGLGGTLLTYVGEFPKNHLWGWPRPEILSGGLQGSAQALADILFAGVSVSLEFMLLLLVLRILLRREGPAVAVLFLLMTWGLSLPGPFTPQNLICSGLAAGLLVVAWIRFGPLAGAAGWVTSLLSVRYPLTANTSAWYAGRGLFAILIIVSLVLYGFATSVAGQPWFARSGVLDD